ncbi:C1 family peptidase [Paenibacillus peoriae]|uniref:C1 family peptidase n=1 Tax=Paenibacillus peoriae TaxID=59893 RepID=UPI00096C5565|nr:C1 family peptidase [Paenibacillus peoriae]OMF31940.1 hypothetical protein BK134_12770 [Paenibacillus peoriae]
MEAYGTGYIPSPIDKRDFIMEGFLPLILLSPEIDYSTPEIKMRSQGTQNTCVGFAFSFMKEYQELKEHKRYIQFSPLYLYRKCKEVDGIPEDGTHPRIAAKILLKTGICEESFLPYNTIGDETSPKSDADKNALKYRIKAFAQLTNIQSMKRSLAINGPFVAGLPISMNDWLIKVSKTGRIPMPDNIESLQLGHAICVIGYDDNTQVFKFQNSWGEHWGDKGFGYLPYKYMELYCKEAYGVTDLITEPEGLIEQKEEILLERGEKFVVSRDEAKLYGIQ